jgi:ABC-2 type transport system ATP-binding protein
MIELINLTKTYKGIAAVDRVSLHVDRGRIFGFLGPNGAGKTTTIRMMAGVLKPTGGRVIINGMDLARKPAAVKKCVGFIPDRPFLYEKLTGKEFLQFVAGLYELDHAPQTRRRMGRLLELFDLHHWAEELIESYSHGMKQRLVMCAALLHEPRVIIVDEPTVGLDPGAIRLVKNIFKNEAQRGTTVFMSTHSLEVAQEICEEIAIIREGKIIATGTPEDLKRQAGLEGNLESIFLKITEGKTTAHEPSPSSL